MCAPYTPQAQAAHQACCPEMPRHTPEGVCRISAWQLWESKAAKKVRPKQDYLSVMLQISYIRVNCIKIWIQFWTVSILKMQHQYHTRIKFQKQIFISTLKYKASQTVKAISDRFYGNHLNYSYLRNTIHYKKFKVGRDLQVQNSSNCVIISFGSDICPQRCFKYFMSMYCLEIYYLCNRWQTLNFCLNNTLLWQNDSSRLTILLAYYLQKLRPQEGLHNQVRQCGQI